MKICHIIVIVLILSFYPLSAQRFQGGVLAGVTASQVDGDSYGGFNKIGLQGGVFVNTRFKYNFGAQLEIRYAGKGARKPTSSEDTEVYKLALHYIDLPLMLTYTFKKKVIFDLGIVPGYLFAKNGEDNGGRLPQDFLVDYNIIDIAWLAGVNYKITENFIVNARYSYSLMSIHTYQNLYSNYGWIGNLFGYNTGDYNNYLTFGIYYQFY
ncbi:MAG: PorT family protein [Bacteroidales bacterium]|nr:PorT family protein [Bacteroidales bacterium]